MILFVLYQRAKMKSVVVEEDDYGTIDKILEAVKLEMVEIVKEDYSLGLSDAEFNALYKRKARINDALRNCVYGIDSAKIIVIELIRTFIAENVPKANVTDILGLSEGLEPSNHVKFEIMMYRYKKKYGKEALTKWLVKYDFLRERTATDAEKKRDVSYYVTVDDLLMTWEEEAIHLSIEEQIDVLAVLVYQLYKGFGIVDTLREMNINGFNLGASGSIMSNITKETNDELKATSSVWIYQWGKYVHFRFMNFGHEDECKRIIQLLIRYGNPGPLTAKRGYMVNTMYDKSRILAIRPPASEYWCIFIRKFGLSDLSTKAIIAKPYVHRPDLPMLLIEFLIRGMTTCAVTGRQGSGKTTLMSSIIRYVDPRYTLRILEMAPELYLREIYKTRNILSVQETTTVTAAELQDALKKSDAAVSIVGEVATDIIAARMIQMGQVASLFTIFSHHANTAKDLVYALRNSLVNAGGFSNMDTAERQVTDVVKIDIHLDFTPDGKRFIERISEIVPLPANIPYPEIDKDNLEYSKLEIEKEYYQRSTDRISFYTHDILRYDLTTDTYVVCDRISPVLEERIRYNLGPDMRPLFDKFMTENWPRRTAEELAEEGEDAIDRVYDAMEHYTDSDFIDNSDLESTKELEVVEGTDETSTVEDQQDAEIFFDFFDGGESVDIEDEDDDTDYAELDAVFSDARQETVAENYTSKSTETADVDLSKEDNEAEDFEEVDLSDNSED